MDTSASVKSVKFVPFMKVPLMKAVTSKVYKFGLTAVATVMTPEECPMEK